MKIAINKDIEEAYKDEFFKGFTLRETAYIVIALTVMIGVTVLLYLVFGLNLSVGVYIGAPLGLPFVFIGFKKYQGLTLSEYLREKSYRKKTRILLYEADELPDKRKEFFVIKTKEKRRKNG